MYHIRSIQFFNWKHWKDSKSIVLKCLRNTLRIGITILTHIAKQLPKNRLNFHWICCPSITRLKNWFKFIANGIILLPKPIINWLHQQLQLFNQLQHISNEPTYIQSQYGSWRTNYLWLGIQEPTIFFCNLYESSYLVLWYPLRCYQWFLLSSSSFTMQKYILRLASLIRLRYRILCFKM